MNTGKRQQTRAGLTLLVVLTAPVVFSVAQTTKGAGQQTSFSAEDETVTPPIKAPKQVKDMIAESEFGKLLLQDTPDHVIPDRWLSVSEADLGPSGEKDLVVLGVGQIRGANVTSFWVFAPSAGEFRLLLYAVGHDLEIKKARSGGYRDIDVLKATATRYSRVQYRFDGRVYRSHGSAWQPIR